MPNAGVIATLAVTLASAVQLSACASSKSITSLDSDKPLSKLTTEERRQYCEDRFHYLSTQVSTDDRKKIKCAAAAATVEGGSASDKARAACEQVYQTCMGTPATELQGSCDDFPKAAAECTATVGEASACATAQAKALDQLAHDADTTCKDDQSHPKESKDHVAAQPPADCARVELLCPKLFDEPALRGDTGKP